MRLTHTKTGLDEHQVRRWTPWRRWTLLAMLAHALLAVLRLRRTSSDHSPGGRCRWPTPPTGPDGAGITNIAPRPATTPATEFGSHDQRSTTAVQGAQSR